MKEITKFSCYDVRITHKQYKFSKESVFRCYILADDIQYAIGMALRLLDEKYNGDYYVPAIDIKEKDVEIAVDNDLIEINQTFTKNTV